jgi:hypothetical protein
MPVAKALRFSFSQLILADPKPTPTGKKAHASTLRIGNSESENSCKTYAEINARLQTLSFRCINWGRSDRCDGDVSV